jgi:hypothetical protein
VLLVCQNQIPSRGCEAFACISYVKLIRKTLNRIAYLLPRIADIDVQFQALETDKDQSWS